MNGVHQLQQHAELQAALQSTLSHPTAGNVCPVCRKAFDRMYNLKVHFRKHTGETPYTCPVQNCAKQFRWRSSMAHHVRAHHDASETAGVSLRTSTDAQGAKGNAKAQTPSVVTRPLRTTSSISQVSGIQKPQRKRTPKVSKAAKRRQSVSSPSALQDSVNGLHAEPESPPLLTISADPLRLADECHSNDAELLCILPDVLSGESDILDDSDEMGSSVPSTFADDPLEESADVMLFLVTGPEDVENAALKVLDGDESLKAAVEATNLPMNQYSWM
ncbi:unnamed protein product [Agarophyton chilense]